MTPPSQTPPKDTGRRRHQSTSPTGSERAGRRESAVRRPPEKTALQRFRTPILALVAIAALVGIGMFTLTSATAPA